MQPEPLFVAKLDALEARIATGRPSEYELLEAAGTLRHILLDGLLDSANRRLRLLIRFSVALPPPVPEHMLVILQNFYHADYDTVQPDKAPSHWKRASFTRDQFLGHEVGIVRGTSYTVRDVIRLAANSLGGVHHGDPKASEKDLHDFNRQSAPIVEIPSGLRHIHGIAIATLHACLPLRDSLR